jgi:hypothetical protein
MRFFVDENMLPIGRALALVRDDVCHPGHPAIPEVALGTDDPDWLPIVGQRGLVLLTRDNKIRTKPAELQAYKDHRIRAFFLTGKKDLTRWEKLDLLVRQWEKIEAAIKKVGKGPWAMSVTAGASPRDVPLMPLPKTK